MNKKEAAKLLAIVRATYPGVKIENPETMAYTWELCFGEYDADIVAQAVKLHMKRNKYFPTIAEIVKLLPRAELLCSSDQVKMIESHVEQADIDGEALFRWLTEDEPTKECISCLNFSKCYLQEKKKVYN